MDRCWRAYNRNTYIGNTLTSHSQTHVQFEELLSSTFEMMHLYPEDHRYIDLLCALCVYEEEGETGEELSVERHQLAIMRRLKDNHKVLQLESKDTTYLTSALTLLSRLGQGRNEENIKSIRVMVCGVSERTD